jgi:hypothetical protein
MFVDNRQRWYVNITTKKSRFAVWWKKKEERKIMCMCLVVVFVGRFSFSFDWTQLDLEGSTIGLKICKNLSKSIHYARKHLFICVHCTLIC